MKFLSKRAEQQTVIAVFVVPREVLLKQAGKLKMTDK